MSTDTDTTMEQPTRHHVSSSTTHRHITWAALLVAIGVISTLLVGALVNREREAETNRADNAIIALDQACEQVRLLGGRCLTEPSDVDRNPPARAPTEAEIAAAVADYLTRHPVSAALPTNAQIAAEVAAYLAANPPPAGEPGQSVTQADIELAVAAWLAAHPLPMCPDGWHSAELMVRDQLSNNWQTIITCVR